MTAQGLIAIKALKKEGITTLGTAVYSVCRDWWLAALKGAKYVAPYVNRVDAQGGDGIRMVQELQSLLELTHLSMVLAANFKTPRQALDCLLAGCEAITLPLDAAQQMPRTPAVESNGRREV